MVKQKPEKQEETVDLTKTLSTKETNEEQASEEHDEKVVYSGICIGGPFDGKLGESRFPGGFVLIDRPNSAAWVYDFDESTQTFTAREQDIHDNQRGVKAAEGSDYDVRAFDREDWSAGE